MKLKLKSMTDFVVQLINLPFCNRVKLHYERQSYKVRYFSTANN